MPRPGCFTPGKDPVPIVYEAGWAPGPVWMDAENLAPVIRSPDHPAPSESLYRLSYPGPLVASRVTYNKFHIEDPQILGTTIQYFVIQVNWPPRFVHP